MSSLSSIRHLSFIWLWLALLALAQRDCERDGDTSTYNQNSLVVPFENLCGKDFEASLDYFSSSEPRPSDCIDRCVKQAPLCYGFDYTLYTSRSQHNCYLVNGTSEASNATYRNFIADAGILNPNLATKLPKSCQTLSLRDCLEKNVQLVPSASATSISSSSSRTTPTASMTSAPTASSNNGEQTTAGTGDCQPVRKQASVPVLVLSPDRNSEWSTAPAQTRQAQESSCQSTSTCDQDPTGDS